MKKIKACIFLVFCIVFLSSCGSNPPSKKTVELTYSNFSTYFDVETYVADATFVTHNDGGFMGSKHWKTNGSANYYIKIYPKVPCVVKSGTVELSVYLGNDSGVDYWFFSDGRTSNNIEVSLFSGTKIVQINGVGEISSSNDYSQRSIPLPGTSPFCANDVSVYSVTGIIEID